MASGARSRGLRSHAGRPRSLPTRSLVLLAVLLVSAPASAAVLSHATARQPAPAHKRHHGPNRRRTVTHVQALIPAGETLLTVSCSITRNCLTVGADETNIGPRTLDEVWNGVMWRFGRADPNRGIRQLLSAVSCPAPRDCVAVGAHFSRSGQSEPLAEKWNGSTWHVLPTPKPPARRGNGSALTGIACPSPSVCIAVGSNQTKSGVQTLAERWDGRRWRILRTPDARHASVSVLTAVACSAPAACTAVGTYVSGGVRAIEGSGPSGSGVSPGDRAPGKQSVPTGQHSAAHVGFALAERWNGARWLVQRAASISPGANNALSGVSCPAAKVCVAVGGAQGAGPQGLTGVTLTEIWNGATWHLLPGPSPASAKLAALDGVTCRSATNCQAVGYYEIAGGLDLTLIAARNGASWTIEPSASRGIAAELFAVSCPAARYCIAVGGYGVRSGTRLTLGEVWNGIRWQVQQLATS